MILVDTSVWIDHFRTSLAALSALLTEDQVLTHPFVIGELACGNLRNRRIVLEDLGCLPQSACATHEEVLRLVEAHELQGFGIGWIDVHLLASARLTGCRLWTLDRPLARAADRSGVKLVRPPELPA